MKLEILNENQNAVLRRKELQVAIAHDNEPTPSKAALQELMSKQFGHEKEKIDVRSVYSDRGRARSLSKIFVWEELPPKKVDKKKEKVETKEAKTEVKKKEEKEETKEEGKEKREKEEIEAKAEKEEETKPVIEEQEEAETEEA